MKMRNMDQETSGTPLRAKALAIAMIAIIASPFAAAAYGAGPFAPYRALTQVLQVSFPVTPEIWIGIAFLAVLVVTMVAAVVYQIGFLIDSPTARAWAKFQAYEALFSIALIIIFVSFIFLLTVNPEGSLAQANLVAPPGSTYSCSGAQSLFELATCDIAQFNIFAFGLFQVLYYVTFYGGITPGINISGTVTVQNIWFSVSDSLSSFLPVGVLEIFDSVFSVILGLLFLNQLQLLIVSASMLWLSFFMTVGLIARTFGFMRTFGGAMIAFGLGLGLVYPLLTSLTYGFVDYQLSTSSNCGSGCTVASLGGNLMGAILGIAVGLGLPTGSWVYEVAMALAGMTFIPFLNFTILDAFIVDFSQAVGERMDFMTLLAGLV